MSKPSVFSCSNTVLLEFDCDVSNSASGRPVTAPKAKRKKSPHKPEKTKRLRRKAHRS